MVYGVHGIVTVSFEKNVANGIPIRVGFARMNDQIGLSVSEHPCGYVTRDSSVPVSLLCLAQRKSLAGVGDHHRSESVPRASHRTALFRDRFGRTFPDFGGQRPDQAQ